jgi:4-carboxymuconolactone decarboxylase
MRCQRTSRQRNALSILPTLALAAVAVNLITVSAAAAQDRMPPITPEKFDEAQKKEADAFLVARKGPVFGPFSVLIRSPELMTAYRIQGDYLRLKPSIGTNLSELVILVAAREWTQDYEWYVHAPIALKRGVSQEIIDAIAEGRRPTGMNEDQQICYDFSVELHRNKRIADATYERAVKRFGEKGRPRYRRHQRLLRSACNGHEYDAIPNSFRRQAADALA